MRGRQEGEYEEYERVRDRAKRDAGGGRGAEYTEHDVASGMRTETEEVEAAVQAEQKSAIVLGVAFDFPLLLSLARVARTDGRSSGVPST